MERGGGGWGAEWGGAGADGEGGLPMAEGVVEGGVRDRPPRAARARRPRRGCPCAVASARARAPPARS